MSKPVPGSSLSQPDLRRVERELLQPDNDDHELELLLLLFEASDHDNDLLLLLHLVTGSSISVFSFQHHKRDEIKTCLPL